MPKRRRHVNAVSNNSLKTHALGRGESYEPYLHIQDVPSIGLATREKGWKTKRIHHFLSKLEWLYFFILEWSPIVTDIREQYPLDIEETLAIAESIGIKHPINVKTKKPIVMTTDFLITIKKHIGIEEHARTIKYASQLSSIRVIEKFEIERVYWTRRDVKWDISTEKEIDNILAANIEWVHPYRDLSSLRPLTKKMVREVELILAPQVLGVRFRLSELTSACDNHLGLDIGTSLMVVRHLLATKRWQVNMYEPIRPAKKMLFTSAQCSTTH
ncbi:MAG: TnsA endonuclease N-terminal domain-containing protein [Acidobacteriota bacterium]|nr:TnsA endonuclease N-terminal domain-containing protein [Acidobacteriota bacterium]